MGCSKVNTLDNPEKINLRIIGSDKARWYLQHQARALSELHHRGTRNFNISRWIRVQRV